MKIGKITIDMDEYPNHLRSIPNPPRMLYYIGNLELIKYPSFAIVGTRRASPYGRWVTTEISKRIAVCGFPIISGMAEGVDTCAHRACLDVGTPTIAVLGTGIDVPFPRSNTKLYEEISENGLILSEFEPGNPGYRANFPQRNRIISGLAKTVIVTEGAYRSGSMITAGLALTQGREVFAVPGNINQPNATGTNSLIFDGAGSIIDLNELLVTLGISGNQLEITLANCSEEELRILEIIKDNPGISVDGIAASLYGDVSRIITKTCSMELKGLIRKEGAGFFYT